MDAMRPFPSLYLATWIGRTTSRDAGVEGLVWWRSCVSEPGLPLDDDVPYWLWMGQSGSGGKGWARGGNGGLRGLGGLRAGL